MAAPPLHKTHWKLTLAYDGSGFHGWQIQSADSGLKTIQGTLADCLFRLTGETVLPQGSGRTDTGVHALAQVASFALAAPIPAANLHRALNRILPAPIRVLACEEVPPSFHARHSARGKTYEYRIFERRPERGSTPGKPATISQERICSPFLAPFVWDCRWPLSLDAMQQAAELLLGTHDFTSMAATDPERSLRDPDQERSLRDLDQERSLRDPDQERSLRDPDQERSLRDPNQERSLRDPDQERSLRAPEEEPSLGEPDEPSSDPRATKLNPVKTITLAEWSRRPREHPELLIFRIAGTGFLHHMVRNIVGTLVEIGRGSLTPCDLPPILAARNRTAAGPTAPARGLFLAEVLYDLGNPLTTNY